MSNIQGGYKAQTVTQVANLLSAYEAKAVSLKAVRVYLAALVSAASREAASRSKTKVKRRGEVTTLRFATQELARLTGLSESVIKRELKALRQAGLMTFGESEVLFETLPIPESEALSLKLSGNRSPKRPVPIPRSLLRLLAKSSKGSTIKTALAYAVRGLTLTKTGEIRAAGSVKATWIANTLNMSERSVRSARSELLGLGFITDDEGSHQLKLNRTGAYFTVNLSFAVPKFAPPPTQNRVIFAPLIKDRKTPYGSKNQKTQPQRLNSSGVCTANTGEQNSVKEGRLPKPNIRDVRAEDLKSFGRVEELYRQAVRQKLIEPTEAGVVNFISAACRARGVTKGDSAKIFIGIIRQNLWTHITQRDEDRALTALRKFRSENPNRFRYCVP